MTYQLQKSCKKPHSFRANPVSFPFLFSYCTGDTHRHHLLTYKTNLFPLKLATANSRETSFPSVLHRTKSGFTLVTDLTARVLQRYSCKAQFRKMFAVHHRSSTRKAKESILSRTSHFSFAAWQGPSTSVTLKARGWTVHKMNASWYS